MRHAAVLVLAFASCTSPEAPRYGDGWLLVRDRHVWATASLPPHPDGDAWRFDGPRLEIHIPDPRRFALLPGLAFLEGPERPPHSKPAAPHTPLAAVQTDDGLVLLDWTGPSRIALVGSPDTRLVLEPAAGARVRLLKRGDITDALPLWLADHPLPAPRPWPRSLPAELDLCRAGFRSLQAPRGKHRRHGAPDAPADWVPGFGVLLHHLGEMVDWDLYPDLLSTEFCRVVDWEAPALAGEPKRLQRLPERVAINLGLRGEDGEWGYHPGTRVERTLGTAGESVLGTNAPNLLLLAKAARLSGDEALRGEALASLDRLRRHTLPRGGRPGERPLREPHLLAAAYALGAALEVHRLAPDPARLRDAVRYARLGLPFLRFDPVAAESPGDGLVFAYYLRRLGRLDASLDWTRIAEGLLAHAVHLQRTSGPWTGCLPEPGEPDANPEPLVAVLLAMQGRDPDPAWR